nr:hypothetical protein [Tanacetum cinerariifolium]
VSNDQIEDFSESNNEVSLIDDDSFSIYKIDYVEASPPESELVSSEVMEIVIPEGFARSSIPENLKTLAKGFDPPSLNFLSFSWES